MDDTTGYVLYAEDNPTDYTFFKRVYHKLDVTARLVHRDTGSLAKSYLLTCLSHGDPLPRLVVLDIKMPGLSGLEVLEFIRSHPRLQRLPVIILSGSGEDRDISRAYDSQVNAYLVKPNHYRQLKELVATIYDFWGRYNQVAL